MKNQNPFLIKGYRGPEFFCDRERETAKLVAAVENGRDVTLIAPRRYGKTGLIHNVFHKLRDDYVVVYMDIYSTQSLADFVRIFSSAVVGALDSRIEKIGKDIWTFFKSCRPTVTPQEDGSARFSFDVSPATAELTLEEIFAYLRARKRACVIAIDEFQQVRSYPEKGVEALLRSYIQFADSARFIFAGSKKHMMEEMFALPRGPFYQSTQLMALDVIDKDAYRSFASKFFKKVGLGFDDSVFDKLYDKFGGVTWYVQAILNRAWENLSGLVDDAALQECIDTLVDEGRYTYHDLLFSQTSAGQSVLRAIAKEGVVQEVSGRGFVAKYNLPAPSTIRSTVSDLLARDLLYRTDAGVVIYDRIFGIWLAAAGGARD